VTFRLITVGIADFVVAKPPDILRTILGSCIGICLFDNKNQVGGLSHIMLPKMNQNSENINKKKYADSAIPMLLEKMLNKGADKAFITAKIVGGSTMFKISKDNPSSNIGQLNINGVRDVLGELNIRIIAEELGGDYGRTIDFYMDTGSVKIKYLNKEIKII